MSSPDPRFVGCSHTQSTPQIVGLDLSLTATGICSDSGAAVFKSKLAGPARLADIRVVVAKAIFDAPGYEANALVLIEGYSYASANQAHQLGELGGVIRTELFECGVPYLEIPPTVLKKFGTNNGGASKDLMGHTAVREGYDGPADNNCVDAWWLHQMGRYALDLPGLARTKYRDEAIGKVDWPEGLDAA